MSDNPMPPGLTDIVDFPLVKALTGRRSRRVALGTTTPEGPLHFHSDKEPLALTELERSVVLTAMSGGTGWHYLIIGNPRYAPYLGNYAGSATGRTFPSAAGYQTSDLFFTDDTGLYYLPTRDAPPAVELGEYDIPDFSALVEAQKSRIRKLQDGRMNIPREEAFIEGHNLWIANAPGSLLVIPVGDLAQVALLALCYYLQNGFIIRDDINDQGIPGIDRFGGLADLDNPLPLSFVEQWCLGELVTELSCSCYAGALMLQAMGLGGWLFNGMNPFAILGASGDPRMPGLGFRFDTDDRWSVPNPTGLEGVFEGFCPPHYSDMRAALDALVERKFGKGGPFHRETPGKWKDTPGVRGSAQVHSEEFKECVGLMAQYVFDRFGKFPGTTPSMLVLPYLQAHHLDLEFYDRFFEPGAYLDTHARHMERWHADENLQS